ncbi:WD40-repeat-containing domain protein [Lyophyllum atratum]|nr:WD40-repeat-containing domain protein [Lyophyllum atratum]
MPPNRAQVIDVDAPVIIDLTAPPVSIDLTAEPGIEQSPPRRPPRARARVVYVASYIPPSNLPGPSSAIETPRRRALASISRTTSAAEPPTKKQKIEEVIYFDIPPLPDTGKGKGVKRIFELDSDGEVVDLKPKRIKREGTPSSDSDEEDSYARCHAGYDLNNEDIWKPPKINQSKMSFDVAETFQHLTISDAPSPTRRRPHWDFSDPSYPFPSTVKWSHPPGRVYPPARSSILSLMPAQLARSNRRVALQPMKLITSFKRAPGSINRIEQSGEWVAISSAATGGQSDVPGEELNPYNKEGGIMMWNSDLHILPGHSRKWDSDGQVKHYTVNDVKFDLDPTSSSAVSSGNDKTVHVWTHDPDKNLYNRDCAWRCDSVPHDLAFKPGTSVLAVGERKLVVYSDTTSTASVLTLSVCGKKTRTKNIVGAIEWGRGPTSSYLFASSESDTRNNDFNGFHKAFDVNQGTMAYEFDAKGSGDEIAVTEDGGRLALLTCRESSNSLRIYNIRNKAPNAILSLELEPFPVRYNVEKEPIEGEVNSAAFSSDGIYLALGRNDNHTHVYDSRWLNRLLFDYEHYGPCRTNPYHDSYGVVKVQWVNKEAAMPFGLVTAGHDGCVRFWDPLRAPNSSRNGSILAEMTSDIGAFSIGDRYKGEQPLVVGDCSGEVSVFDINPSGLQYLYR